jgi:hypothetical protein
LSSTKNVQKHTTSSPVFLIIFKVKKKINFFSVTFRFSLTVSSGFDSSVISALLPSVRVCVAGIFGRLHHSSHPIGTQSCAGCCFLLE